MIDDYEVPEGKALRGDGTLVDAYEAFAGFCNKYIESDYWRMERDQLKSNTPHQPERPEGMMTHDERITQEDKVLTLQVQIYEAVLEGLNLFIAKLKEEK